eukprot:4542371-Alexandrium_andersonii.AAC.1
MGTVRVPRTRPGSGEGSGGCCTIPVAGANSLVHAGPPANQRDESTLDAGSHPLCPLSPTTA